MTPENIIGLVSAASVIVVALISYFGGRSQRVATHADIVIKLTDQVNELSIGMSELRVKLDTVVHTNKVLWQYIYALVEQLKAHGLTPIDPPSELETDPRLMALVAREGKVKRVK